MPDYDSPWKEAMDRYFKEFLAFFFPLVDALLDWKRDCESLDTELRKLTAQSETGKRFIDKLVKAWKLTRDPRFVHVEVQCQPEDMFERRMCVYNSRIDLEYNHPVMTLVVLGDESQNWRPTEYVYEEAGSRRTLTFPMVKLLDYAKRSEELERDENPFGMMVVAHLTAQRTSKDIETRKVVKLRLLKGLHNRGMDAEDVRQWYRYMDWLLPLTVQAEQEVTREIEELEKEKTVPFITFAERMGLEKGELQGLCTAAELGLELKFGGEGVALMPAIREATDLEKVRQIVQTIRTATNLDDIRRLLTPPAPPPAPVP